MKGRKPIPTRLKLLRGSKRYSRKQERSEQKPPTTEMDVREIYSMSDRQIAIYDRLAPILKSLGLLTDADHDLFIHYVRAAALIEIVHEKLLQPDVTSRLPSHQERMILQTFTTAMYKIGCEFGLTPSSRSRLSVHGVTANKADEDFERLMTPIRQSPKSVIFPLDGSDPDGDSGGGLGDAPDAG